MFIDRDRAPIDWSNMFNVRKTGTDFSALIYDQRAPKHTPLAHVPRDSRIVADAKIRKFVSQV